MCARNGRQTKARGSMPEMASLIILVGGESRRMGRAKPLLPTPSGTLIDHIARRLRGIFSETIVVGRSRIPVPLGARFVSDRYPARSPLVGIEAGLTAAACDLCFVIACDMPFGEPALVRYLLWCADRVDAVVPVVGGYDEPLFTVYRKGALPVIRAAIEGGALKVSAIYPKLRVRRIEEGKLRKFDPTLSSFINLNTPRELSLLGRLLIS